MHRLLRQRHMVFGVLILIIIIILRYQTLFIYQFDQNNVINNQLLFESKPLLERSAISKDLTISRVYFDNRSRKGHTNHTVFFINANWTIYTNNWIVGCGIGNRTTSQFRIRIPVEWYWIRGYARKVPFKYEHLYVDCYDLPVKLTDKARLFYKTSDDSDIIAVESDYPFVVFPEPRITSDNDKYDTSAVACIKANTNGAYYLPSIFKYQRAIGVDHVSLITLSSFIKDGGLKSLLVNNPSIIQQFIDVYISVDMWKEWYSENKKDHEIRLWTESIRKVACSYHYCGTYDWAIPIDTDDFFTPRTPNQLNVKYYLRKYCSRKNIGSCMMDWVHYYPQFCGLNDSLIPDNGNLTYALKSSEHHKDVAPKSIHRTQFLIDATFHDAKSHHGSDHSLLPGYRVKKIHPSICYIAHIRRFAKPPSSICHKWKLPIGGNI